MKHARVTSCQGMRMTPDMKHPDHTRVSALIAASRTAAARFHLQGAPDVDHGAPGLGDEVRLRNHGRTRAVVESVRRRDPEARTDPADTIIRSIPTVSGARTSPRHHHDDHNDRSSFVVLVLVIVIR